MKKITFLTLLIIVVLSIPYSVKSQCPNLNFSMGNFTNWQGYMGSCGSGININPSVITSGRHTIMDGAKLLSEGKLYDEYCLKIKKVPDGFGYAAKLGNEQSGAEMEAIEYTLTVDSSNSFLMVHFAYVMQYISDTSHSPENQPRFTMVIKDSAGNNISSNILPCAFYNFISSPDLDDLACTGNIVARDWTTVGYSLESLMGRTIKIYFETRDCTLSGHFGYAYVVAECRSLTIDLMHCGGATAARFRAPDGFKKYTWRRSSNPNWIWSDPRGESWSLTLTDPVANEIISCEMESTLNPECLVTVHTVVRKTSIDATFFYGIVENGGVDIGNPYQNWYDTCNRTATFVDRSKVVNGKQTSRSWYIHGLNQAIPNDSMVTITFPDPGLQGLDSVRYLVRLTVRAENGCIDTSKNNVGHYITIYASPRIEIEGVTQMCQLDTVTLKTNVIRSKFIHYEWTWYDTNNVKQTSTGDSLNITYPGTYYLESIDVNGCIVKDTHIVTHLIPDINIIEIQSPSCFGGNDGSFVHGVITGGQVPYKSFTWMVTDSAIWDFLSSEWEYDAARNAYIDPNGSTTENTYINLPAGTYIFKAIDDRGCILKGEVEITDPNLLEISATQEAAAGNMNNGTIILTATGGTPPYTYSVEKNGQYFTTVKINNGDSAKATGLNTGTYTVSVTDAGGNTYGTTCTTVDTITVKQRAYQITLQSSNDIMGTVGFLQYSNTSDTIIFQAIAFAGYQFVQWSDGITDNPRTIILTQDTNFTAEFASIVNVKEVETYANHINVFPNPVQNTLHFQSSSPIEQVIIYDISGRILFQTSKVCETFEVLDISLLANGIYLVKVKTKEGEVIRKIIKQ
jgi:hypothetical protein